MQNLGIVEFDDYATKVPSISFISVGPGTQTFFMRGVSDGSNPNYANTSATGFFLDDSSLSWFGVEPDLHLYDIQRIEVLNGPQGTTFGASSMAGAIRYITNKPDVNAFSGGADFDGGKIQSAQQNWTYEGFVNIPLIEGVLGFRASAFSASHGGFITNRAHHSHLGERHGLEQCPMGARGLQPRAPGGRPRRAQGGAQRQVERALQLRLPAHVLGRRLGRGSYARAAHGRALRSAGTQQPGENRAVSPRRRRRHRGPGIREHLLGSLPTRRWDEYSQYMENFNGGAQEGFTCLSDPTYGGTPFSGCNVPLQYYEYHTNPERWSDELRLASKAGGRFHWLGGALLGEDARQELRQHLLHARDCRTDGAAFQYENAYYGTTGSSLPPGQWYAYTTRSDYLQTTEFANISYDITSRLNVEAGTVHFHSDFKYYSPYGQFAYNATTPALSQGSSHKWDSKLGMNYKVTDTVMLYADWAQGFRDGGANSGDPAGCYTNGVPPEYITRHPQQLRDRLEDHQPQRPPAVERRGLLHGLEGSADADLRHQHLPLEQFQRQCRRGARLRR